jgi:hypothetical protein
MSVYDLTDDLQPWEVNDIMFGCGWDNHLGSAFVYKYIFVIFCVGLMFLGVYIMYICYL